MAKWVEDCKREYNERWEDCKEKYVECLLNHASPLHERAIRRLYELNKTHGYNQYFSKKDIYQDQQPSGIYIWCDDYKDGVKKTGAGIVERNPSRRAFRIKAEFYDAVGRALKE